MNFFGSFISDSDHHTAFATLRGYKSSLVWFYKENRQTIPPEQDLELESFLRGYKRRIAELKQTGEMAVFEGKHHITFTGYCLIAKKFFSICPAINQEHNKSIIHTWNQMLFSWC